MTREDIKAQLAKCPLEWTREECGRFWYEYLKAEINLSELRLEYHIRYDYENYKPKRVGLYLTAMDCAEVADECIEMRGFGNLQTLDELKTIAEDHRLLFACRLLGVKE